MQAAIGQGNTVVTAVQLATYAGTLANRGVRYRTHFVKAILDTNTGKVLQETQPEVMDVIEDRGDTFDLVRQGMVGVSQTVSGLKTIPSPSPARPAPLSAARRTTSAAPASITPTP